MKKTKPFLSISATLLLLSTFTLSSAFAGTFGPGDGSKGGGGGDAAERRMNEIRADLLKWIDAGGAQALRLPERVSYGEYVSVMSKYLAPKAVGVTFTNDKVLVDGKEKTCRNYRDQKSMPQMLCNLDRFNKTLEGEQYRLGHHEYAGIDGLELNEGAQSDYEISDQIATFLEPQKVLRLVVKKAPDALKQECSIRFATRKDEKKFMNVMGVLRERGFHLASEGHQPGFILSTGTARVEYNVPFEAITGYESNQRILTYGYKTIKSESITLTHVLSGFKTSISGDGPDLSGNRVRLQGKLREASSIQESMDIQNELGKPENQNLPARTTIESFIGKIPSCEALYKTSKE